MTKFTATEKEAIKEWLSGSKDWLLEVYIDYNDSLGPGGRSTPFPIRVDTSADWSTLSSAGVGSPTRVDVSEVRYKVYGIDQELKFRAPSISFVWPSFTTLEKKVERRSKIRFRLHVEIANGTTKINLLTTDWYKIKDVQVLHTTAKDGEDAGSDAKITAIPWIYEYNDKIKWQKTRYLTKENISAFDGNSLYLEVPTDLTEYATSKISSSGWTQGELMAWRTKTLFAFESSMDSVGGILAKAQVYHKLKNMKEVRNGQTVFYEDAPCPYSGPLLNVVSEAGTNAQKDYRTQYPSTSSSSYYSVGKIVPFGIQTRMNLMEDVDETPLSLISWKAFVYGYGIIPACRSGREDTYYWKEVDAPVLTVAKIFPTKDIERHRYLEELNDFLEVEDKDSDIIFDLSVAYTFRKIVGFPTGEGTLDGRDIDFRMNVSGLVEIGDISQSGKDGDYVFAFSYLYDDVQEQVSSLVHSIRLVDGIRNLGLTLSESDGRFIFFPGFEGENISHMYITTVTYSFNTVEYQDVLGSGKDVVSVDFHGAHRVEKYWGLGPLIATGAGSFEFNEVVEMSTDSYPQYHKVKERIKFSAEWRPWINIYDKIRVEYWSDEFTREQREAFVVAVDANVDTLSASYEALVLPEEQEGKEYSIRMHVDYQGRYNGAIYTNLPDRAKVGEEVVFTAIPNDKNVVISMVQVGTATWAQSLVLDVNVYRFTMQEGDVEVRLLIYDK